MKNHYFAIVILLIVCKTAAAQTKLFSNTYRVGDTLYVHAKAGLSLRASADAKAKVLVVVKFGEPVVVRPVASKVAFSNSGINGVWESVSYKEFTGYQFSGFLSRYKTGYGAQPDIYLKSLFKVARESTKPPDNLEYNQYVESYFSNGIVFNWSAPEGGSSILITFPETRFTFQEVFLMVKEMRRDFFVDDKCVYNDVAIDCSGEYSSLKIRHAPKGDKFHPAPGIEVMIGDAD